MDAKMLGVQEKTAEYQRLKGNSQRIQGLYERVLGDDANAGREQGSHPESVTIMERASRAYRDRSGLWNRTASAVWWDWGWACSCSCS